MRTGLSRNSLKRFSMVLRAVIVISMAILPGCKSQDEKLKIDTSIYIAKGLFERGFYDLAKKHYDDALRDDPDNRQAMKGYGDATRELGSAYYEEAFRALESNKPDLVRTYVQRADKEHGLAFTVFEKLIKISSDNKDRAAVFASMGLLFHQRAWHVMRLSPPNDESDPKIENNVNEGIKYLNQAVDLVPRATTTRMFLGRAYVTRAEVYRQKSERKKQKNDTAAAKIFSEKSSADFATAKNLLEIYLTLLKEDLKSTQEFKPTDAWAEVDKKNALERITKEISETESYIKSIISRMGS
jgi:tetratricopeptide (TPR) repeat protein